MSQPAPPAPPAPPALAPLEPAQGARRNAVGWLLHVARVMLALAAVLVALLAVVGAATLLASWTAAAVRQTMPLPLTADMQVQPEPSSWGALAIWAHRIAPSGASIHAGLNPEQVQWLATGVAAREGAAAGNDDTPLREFAARCVLRTTVEGAMLGEAPLAPAVRDLAALGNALYWERFLAAARIEENTSRRQTLAWASILVGLITTVLVGLRASTLAEGRGALQGTITVLAIAFPAIGTALAAITAFYGPSDEIARSSQQLAALRRVHVQIATEVSAIPCEAAELAQKAITERYPAWFRLYQEAQAAALAATAAAVAQSGGAPTGQAPAAGSAPAPPTIRN